MKMNQNHNLFSFLSRGVTTTHPWCSVFILLVCFIFCANVVSVSASQSNIPEMTNWQFQQAIDAYAGLSDDQKDIANFLTGSQGYAFAGIANSNLNSNFSSFSDTINSAKDYGAKMWSQITDYGNSVANNMLGITNDLSNFFASSVAYAKTRSESFSAWLGNVGIDYNSSSEFRIQFGKNQAQNNIDFYGDDGLYQWQFSSTQILPNDFTFSWSSNINDMTGDYLQRYTTLLNSLTHPVRMNTGMSWKSAYIGSSFFDTYNNIFVDLSNNTVYFCDDNGNKPTLNSYSATMIYYVNGYPPDSWSYPIIPKILNFLVYNNINELFDAINSNTFIILGSNSAVDSFYQPYRICISDWVHGLYIGNSWGNKVPWSNDFDLNLSPTSQYVTVNSPTNVIYLDLNGFMHDLYDNPTIIYNYVINNSVDGNGDPVDGDDFKPTSKFPGIPDSGITIGTEFFKINGLNPLFGSGGYIDALWNNTKGLVLYIGDIFEVLTLDSIDGGGFAWVIYGAVSVGVIGGIFSKFLL